MAWGGGDSDSDTQLIMAVKGGRNDIVKLLLAEESCDPSWLQTEQLHYVLL